VRGKENCRSLGFARDDKGEGSAHLSSRYRGMDRAIASAFFIPLGGPKAHDFSGRDDNSVGPLTFIRPTAFGTISFENNCHPDRSVAQWRDLRFLFQFSRKL